MKHVLHCGHLFDAQSCLVQDSVLIVIDGERIIAEGTADEVAAELSIERSSFIDAESLATLLEASYEDLSRCFVTPGLIDAHVHIGMDSKLPMSRMFQMGGFGEITVRAIQNAQASLQAGFTTLRDECCFAYIDVDVRNLIEQGEVWGPRLHVAGLALSSTGGHADIVGRPGVREVAFPESHVAYIVDGVDAARRATRKVIKYGADHVKLMASGGVLSNDSHPGEQDLLFDEMSAACMVAHAHGKRVSAHAHGAQSIKDALRAGVTSIEHGTLIDHEGCELLCEKDAFLIPTVLAHQRIVAHAMDGSIPPMQIEKARKLMDHVADGLEYLRSIGGNIGFGSDVGITGNAHGRQAREFTMLVEYGGMTPEEALLAATSVNARLLGYEGQLGAIRPGALADIVAFEGNPLEDVSMFKCCRFVMKAGVVYRRDAKAVTVVSL